MTYRIAGIVGSLSTTSINRQLLHGIVPLARDAGMSITECPLAEVPLFSPGAEAAPPAAVTALKAAIEASDGLIIVTPEYNRSIPGVLKNALDWASRPYGHNSLAGKPTAIIGTSRGTVATALAQRHLRDVLGFLDVRLLNQPEACIRFHDGLIGSNGEIADAGVAAHLKTWLDAFGRLLEL
ncbi:MAG: NAD(P)H-dependent oxidoreductase [Actinomycetia bacterium]|nr:NAD(P)H-dependent oxidoreductase [Actinomycetes bacterium]